MPTKSDTSKALPKPRAHTSRKRRVVGATRLQGWVLAGKELRPELYKSSVVEAANKIGEQVENKYGIRVLKIEPGARSFEHLTSKAELPRTPIRKRFRMGTRTAGSSFQPTVAIPSTKIRRAKLSSKAIVDITSDDEDFVLTKKSGVRSKSK